MDVLTITVCQMHAVEISIGKLLIMTSKVESDTFFHSWEVVAKILNDPATKDMLVDVGMGVRHRVSVLANLIR